MAKKQKITRIVSLEDNIINYKSNKYCFWLYCFFLAHSTYHNSKLTYSKNKLYDDIIYINELLNIGGKDYTDKRTVTKYIKKLITIEYLSEDNQNYYVSTKQFNLFAKVDIELLYSLTSLFDELTVIIFCYLTNRIDYRLSEYNSNEYNFTLKQLRRVLGYAETANNTLDNRIKDSLDMLKNGKYIDFDNVYIDVLYNGKMVKVPNYRLTDIAREPISLIQSSAPFSF